MYGQVQTAKTKKSNTQTIVRERLTRQSYINQASQFDPIIYYIQFTPLIESFEGNENQQIRNIIKLEKCVVVKDIKQRSGNTNRKETLGHYPKELISCHDANHVLYRCELWIAPK